MKKTLLMAFIIALAFTAISDSGSFGLFAGLVYLGYKLFKSEPKKKGKVIDYTAKDGPETDNLYRQYASIIDGYYETSLSMMMNALHKDRQSVINDLNVLISRGRFQKAHIEYDENCLVVDEYAAHIRDKDKKTAADYSYDYYADIRAKINSGADEVLKTLGDDHVMITAVSEMKASVNDILDQMNDDQTLDHGDLHKFITFYLPKAVECLNNYTVLLRKASLTGMEVSAKNNLESVILNLNRWFKKLRDSLSDVDAANMAAAAQALDQMLKNDGLAGDFTGFKNVS